MGTFFRNFLKDQIRRRKFAGFIVYICVNLVEVSLVEVLFVYAK